MIYRGPQNIWTHENVLISVHYIQNIKPSGSYFEAIDNEWKQNEKSIADTWGELIYIQKNNIICLHLDGYFVSNWDIFKCVQI